MEVPKDKPKETEVESGSLSNFLLQPLMSDTKLTSSTTSQDINAHRVILSAGSKYFFDYFKQSKADKCKVPNLIETQFKVVDDPLIFVLKYLYASQDFAAIENELTIDKVFNVYSYAYILAMPRLMSSLEDFITTKTLTHEQAVKVLMEGIRFDSEKVFGAAEKLIVENFGTILESAKESEELLNIPFEKFRAICLRDDLNVPNEMCILSLIKDYIAKREVYTEEVTKPEEPKPENKEGGSPGDARQRTEDKQEKEEDKKEDDKKEKEDSKEEKKEEKTEEKKEEKTEEKKEEKTEEKKEEKTEDKKEEKKDAPAEEKKEGENAVQESQVAAEAEPDLPYAKPEVYAKIEERMKARKLTNEQKIELLKCVRYSHLEHKQLLRIFNDPVFALAKDFILQGLSIRLNQYEYLQEEHKRDIILKPRDHYVAGPKEDEGDLSRANTDFGKYQEPPQPNQEPPYPQYQTSRKTPAKAFETKKGVEYRPEDQKVDPTKSAPYQYMMRKGMQEDVKASNATTREVVKGKTLRQPDSPKPPQRTFYRPAPGSKENPLTPEAMQVIPPVEFAYTFDFDEYGLLFFLGTYGKTKSWLNPHAIGQVTVFSSSIGYGSLEDIVGRVATNCRSLNEPLSYFGVDIGVDRAFLPTCYTIRNRNISSHCMLNWQFEGSLDKNTWDVLDRRVYLTNDPVANGEMEAERNALKVKGATSTYALEAERVKGKTGYRYFRILQIGKNSSGSDNLSLSGIELYGKIMSGRFP